VLTFGASDHLVGTECKSAPVAKMRVHQKRENNDVLDVLAARALYMLTKCSSICEPYQSRSRSCDLRLLGSMPCCNMPSVFSFPVP
jgi:hypothetical protein